MMNRRKTNTRQYGVSVSGNGILVNFLHSFTLPIPKEIIVNVHTLDSGSLMLVSNPFRPGQTEWEWDWRLVHNVSTNMG